jgi:hypothetical protein
LHAKFRNTFLTRRHVAPLMNAIADLFVQSVI